MLNDALDENVKAFIIEQIQDKFGDDEIITITSYSYINFNVRFDNYRDNIALNSNYILIKYSDFIERDYKQYKVYNINQLFDTIEWLFDTKIGPPNITYF